MKIAWVIQRVAEHAHCLASDCHGHTHHNGMYFTAVAAEDLYTVKAAHTCCCQRHWILWSHLCLQADSTAVMIAAVQDSQC